MERQRTINAMNQENAIAAEKRGIENRATERGQIRTEEIADEPRKRESNTNVRYGSFGANPVS